MQQQKIFKNNIQKLDQTEEYQYETLNKVYMKKQQIQIDQKQFSEQNLFYQVDTKLLYGHQVMHSSQFLQQKQDIQVHKPNLDDFRASSLTSPQNNKKPSNKKILITFKLLIFIILFILSIYFTSLYFQPSLRTPTIYEKFKTDYSKIYNLMTQQQKINLKKYLNQLKKYTSIINYQQDNQINLQNDVLENVMREKKIKQLEEQNLVLKELLRIQLREQKKKLKGKELTKQDNQKLNLYQLIQWVVFDKITSKQPEKQIKRDQQDQIKLEKPSNQSKVQKQIKNTAQINKKVQTVLNLSKISQSNKVSSHISNNQNTSLNITFTKNYSQCLVYISQKLQKYGSLYQPNMQHSKFISNSHIEQFYQSTKTKITRQKFTQSLELMELIHKVDARGILIVQENPCQSVENITQRLTNVMQKQKKRLNQIYNVDSYYTKQLRFCIVVNSYNNEHNGLIYRNIDSILQQNYTNYHVVYTDDNSPDKNAQIVKKYVLQKNSTQKFKFNLNKQKVGMMKNIYDAITNDCKLGQIVVMVDGDDSLIGTNVLLLLNALYQKQKIALMWNNFNCIFSNSRAGVGFSADFSNYDKKGNTFRQTLGFISSHLKSFYVDLFRKIKIQDLQHENGNFYGGASDLATMYPMIQMANVPESPKFKYIPQILYEYRYDTGQLGMVKNRQFQISASKKIQHTSPYKALNISQFSFINKAIQNTLLISV